MYRYIQLQQSTCSPVRKISTPMLPALDPTGIYFEPVKMGGPTGPAVRELEQEIGVTLTFATEPIETECLHGFILGLRRPLSYDEHGAEEEWGPI